MVPLPRNLALAAAGGILLAGAGVAAQTCFFGTGDRPALAAAPGAAGQGPLQPRSLPALSIPVSRGASVRLANAGPPVPRLPAPLPAVPRAAPAAPDPGLPSLSQDPTRNIALLAVTEANGGQSALLLNLENQERAAARRGEFAFGLQVAEIQDDRVSLLQGHQRYQIRLGEKPVPVVMAAAPPGTTGQGGPESFRDAAGTSGRREAERPRPPGQAGGAARLRDRSRFGQSRFGQGGGGNFSFINSGGGGDWRARFGGSSTGGGQSSSFGGFSTGGRQSSSSGGFPGRLAGGSGGANPSGTGRATPNPQTARRLGVPMVGGVRSTVDAPLPRENPQTVRRQGGTAGSASRSTNPSGAPRSGGAGGLN
ncbi:MAG: hypothetical protein HY320_14580 [Armatimonadetes bacterium]|nr:hypothetical protein [Armatimonadota bacterium]